jgi:hypothetical protein
MWSPAVSALSRRVPPYKGGCTRSKRCPVPFASHSAHPLTLGVKDVHAIPLLDGRPPVGCDGDEVRGIVDGGKPDVGRGRRGVRGPLAECWWVTSIFPP